MCIFLLILIDSCESFLIYQKILIQIHRNLFFFYSLLDILLQIHNFRKFFFIRKEKLVEI